MLVLAYCSIGIDDSASVTDYFISPGSLLSRTILPFPDYSSRVFLPFYIILFGICEFLGSKNKSIFKAPARNLFLFSWLLEILNFHHLLHIPGLLVQLLWTTTFVMYPLAILSSRTEREDYSFLKYSPYAFMIIGLLAPLIPSKPSPLIKATHYYLWFPDNWKAGFGTGTPEDEPLLGRYVMSDNNVIRAHFQEMTNQGISLVIIDWWPLNPILKKRAFRVIKILKEFPNLNFSLQLETLELGLDKKSDLLTLDKKRASLLKKSFEYPAKMLFANPQYYNIENHPTMFMYASRHILGNAQTTLNDIRKHVKDISGRAPYIIGDEAFYQVPEGRDSDHAKLLPQFIPAWDRIRAFDAITLYNPYDPTSYYESLKENDTSDLLIKSATLYDHYKDISNHLGLPFFPTVIPSYNDKMIRPHLHHQVIPRVDKNGISTLGALEKIAEDYQTNSHGPNILIITSFNEWNEGTNIERRKEDN